MGRARFDRHSDGCYYGFAGWSSLVARWAHNPKVGGSNPPPATNPFNDLQPKLEGDFGVSRVKLAFPPQVEQTRVPLARR